MERIRAPKTPGSGSKPKKNKARGLRPTDTINLPEKRELFCQYFITDPELSIKRAAERAGYRNPNQGYQIMMDSKVQLRIAQLKAKRNKRLSIDQDKVLKEVLTLAMSNLGEYFTDWGSSTGVRAKSKKQLSKAQMAAVSEVSEITRNYGRTEITEFKFKLHPKITALKLLMDHLGISSGQGRQQDPNDLVQQMRTATIEAENTMPEAAVPEEEEELDDNGGEYEEEE